MMKGSHKNFGDARLELDQASPPHKEKYEKKGDALLEPKLTAAMKCGFIVLAILFLGVATFVALPMAWKGIPLSWRALLVVTFISFLVLGVLALWILKTGVLKVKTHLTAMIWVASGYSFFLAGMTIYLARQIPDTFKAVQMVVMGLAFFIGGIVVFTFHHLHLAALDNRKKLFDIEYRLAKIAEAMTKKQEK